MRPAIRIIFAPLLLRDKDERKAGTFLHGTAERRTITIDPRGSMILDTLFHEMTHVNHPRWSEQEVRAYTKKRLSKMSWKEKARLLKLLGHAELEGE